MSETFIKNMPYNEILTCVNTSIMFDKTSIETDDIDVSEILSVDKNIKSFSIMFYDKKLNILKIRQIKWNSNTFNSFRILIRFVLEKFENSIIEINLCEKGLKLFKNIVNREKLCINLMNKISYYDKYYKEYKYKVVFKIISENSQ